MNNSNSKNIASGGVEPPPAFLRRPKVRDRLGIGNSSLYNLMDPNSPYHDPTFPKPIRITAKAIGWLETDITSWINSRVEISRTQQK